MPATLPQLFAAPPTWGRIPDVRPPMPYAVIESKLDRREITGTGNTWHDHRRVTIHVYGLKPDVVTALKALTAVFNVGTVLVFPSGARFMRWWPDKGPVVVEDPDRRAGEDVWRGSVEAGVWSIRSV